jgi:hypothetical protein
MGFPVELELPTRMVEFLEARNVRLLLPTLGIIPSLLFPVLYTPRGVCTTDVPTLSSYLGDGV